MRSASDNLSGSSLALAIGAAIGILSFFVLFGVERATGTATAYEWPAGDLAQHVAGAFAYVDGAWSFPIFHTDRLNAPDGVNIIFTDSAPFAGLLAKAAHSLTGLRFNYLGAWFAIAWVGQAAAGAYLMRQLGGRSPFLYLCGAVIALSFPSYLNRHFHLALSSHFLLLFALALYFSSVRNTLTAAKACLWACLLGVAIWTHAYLFVMSAGLFVAAMGDSVLRGTATLPRATVTFIAVLSFSVLLAFIGGYGAVETINATGYGSFRMDLLAYIWPHGSALFPTPAIFDPQSAYEGYNYLGMGGLVAVALGLVLIRRRHLNALKRHPLLMLVIAGMTAFAITNAISFGGQIFMHPDLPIAGFPFSTLRASGRFGWPLGYLLVFVALAVLVNSVGTRWRPAALGMVGVIAALQWADAAQLLRGMQEGWRSAPKPIAEAALTQVDRVHFAPSIECLPGGPVQNAAIEMLAVVARAGVISDSAHTARVKASDCDFTPPNDESGSTLIIAIPDTPEANFYTQERQCVSEAGTLICQPQSK